MNERRQTLIGIVLAVATLAVLFFIFGGGGAGQNTHQIDGQTPVMGSATDGMHDVCEEAFSDQWESSGWVGGTPPVIACSGPDGASGYVDMPQSMQDDKNIQIAEYNGSEP